MVMSFLPNHLAAPLLGLIYDSLFLDDLPGVSAETATFEHHTHRWSLLICVLGVACNSHYNQHAAAMLEVRRQSDGFPYLLLQ